MWPQRRLYEAVGHACKACRYNVDSYSAMPAQKHRVGPVPVDLLPRYPAGDFVLFVALSYIVCSRSMLQRHISFLFPLPLLMLRVAIAYNVDSVLPPHRLTTFTQTLDRTACLHTPYLT